MSRQGVWRRLLIWFIHDAPFPSRRTWDSACFADLTEEAAMGTDELEVYCSECGSGPHPAETRRVQGERTSWPLSTPRWWFWLGTFTCPNCGVVLEVEVPDD